VKDRMHRPTFVFAPSGAQGAEDVLKGSGRSIPGFHLRDALDLMTKRHPGLLIKFGGHAMAAGCSLHEDQIDTFEQAFEEVAQEWLSADALQRSLVTDGPLAADERRIDVADLLQQQVWGSGFEAPVFLDDFEVANQRLVAEKHLGLKLRQGERMFEAIWFGRTEPLPATARLAYRLEADEWQGQRKLKLMVQAQAS
jgi:single-stranded-DNA-specific exonuclease